MPIYWPPSGHGIVIRSAVGVSVTVRPIGLFYIDLDSRSRELHVDLSLSLRFKTHQHGNSYATMVPIGPR